jgi:lipid-A-disaccharide synthase
LRERLLDIRPDVFIGIDAPDFNLGLEIQLRGQGLKTVQYVSPTVWAWREKRVKKIARAADLVMCLFPFEPSFYRDHGVSAVYVGHPLADQLPMDNPAGPARDALGLPPGDTIVALLPGSRMSEVGRLAVPMLEAARRLSQQRPGIRFAAALANEKTLFAFREAMEGAGFTRVELFEKKAKELMAAADVVCSASGTATLETMLINRPMVVTYGISGASYQLAKYSGLVKTRVFALPNILAGEMLVPELIQKDVTAENIAREINAWLDDVERRTRLNKRFSELHEELRCDAAKQAAHAVSGLLAPAPC